MWKKYTYARNDTNACCCNEADGARRDGTGEVRDVGAGREVLDAGVDAVPAAGVGEIPPANDAREREAEARRQAHRHRLCQ